MKQRIHSSTQHEAGFSLLEFIVTLAIITLAASAVATGMPAVMKAYTTVVDAANAQTLLSTSTSLMRDLLSQAMYVEVDEHGKVESFVDGVSGSRVYLENDESKGLMVARVSWNNEGKSEKPAPNDPAHPENDSWTPFAQSIKSQSTGWQLVMGYESLYYDGSDGVGSFEIRHLKVWRSGNGAGGDNFKTGIDEPLEKIESVKIRRIVVNQDL